MAADVKAGASSAADLSADPTLESLRSPLASGISYKGRPVRRLRELLRLERRDLWVVFVYSVAIGLVTLVGPVAIQVLVNFIAFGSLLQPVIVLTLFVLAALVFSAVLTAYRSYTVEMIQRRVFARVAMDFGMRLIRIRTEAFDHWSAPDLVNRFFDVVTVQKAGADLLVSGFSLAMQTLVGMSLLAVYHPLLLAFDVVLLLVMLWVIFGIGRRGVSSAIQESERKYRIAAWLEDLAAHVDARKGASGLAYSMGRVNSLAKDYLDQRRAHYRVVIVQIASTLAVEALSLSILLGFGGLLVMRGELTLGQLVASEVVIALVLSAFVEFGKKLEAYYDMAAALDKLGQVIDVPLERTGADTPIHADRPAEIELRAASKAPTGGEPAIPSLSVHLEAGCRIAVSGPPGSGKSSLARMLAGLTEPDEGSMLFDGIDARNFSAMALRGPIAYLSDPSPVPDTIEKNVTLGREDIGLKEVHDALRQVGLLDTVVSLEQGLQTKMHDVLPLTCEQADRLILARAIAARPRLLVLDEALDRIGDPDAFESICSVVFGPGAPWTTVCVTNRPSVLARCDRCLWLDGTTVESISVDDATSRALEWLTGPRSGVQGCPDSGRGD